MSGAIPTREIYLSCHNVLTAMLGITLYEHLPDSKKTSLPKNFKEDLYTALANHDISKYRWDSELLFGNRPPTYDEWEQEIKPHPVQSASIMRRAGESNKTIDKIIKFHHVRYDGNQFEYFNGSGKINAVHGGYPPGVQGKLLPLGPRIANLADSVCAMRENRPYRKRVMYMEEIMDHIATEAGGQFDPMLVTIFNSIPLEELARIECESVTTNNILKNMQNRIKILRRTGLLKPD